MIKYAISVTLHRDNLTWLRGRVAAMGCKSVSELLDRLVTSARMGGEVAPPRSVVGTIEIDPSDPTLEGGDAAVRDLYETSIKRGFLGRDEMRRRPSRKRAKPIRRG